MHTLIRLAVLLAILQPANSVTADPNPTDPDSMSSSQLARLLGSEADAAFARADEPRDFSFPEDHGPHPRYRNEWWYFTGNLDSEAGRRFGFELTFFRFALSPAVPVTDSAWRTNQIYIAHLALTDPGKKQFHVAQRYSRGALGLAGAQAEPFRVWLENWDVTAAPGSSTWHLRGADRQFGIELSLTPLRPPVLNGDGGLSQKSPEPGNAAYYYSITRLRTEGRVTTGDGEYRVSGLGWLDREWSTSALAPGQEGWDWFALQLSDGSDLMFYGLRGKDGAYDESSAGTWTFPDGRSLHLDRDDVKISILDTWQSPEGGTYPAQWRLQVPPLDLDVTVTPIMPDQELLTIVRYWEGAVDVGGERGGVATSGRGYVELTGYGKPGATLHR